MATDEVICQACEHELVPIGTFHACCNPACDRHAVPCHMVYGGKGYTPHEFAELAQSEGERREQRAAEVTP